MECLKYYGVLLMILVVTMVLYILHKDIGENTSMLAAVKPPESANCSNDPINQKYVNILLVERTNLERRLKLNKACTDQGTPQHTDLDPTKIQETVWVETKHSIFYCAITKVGSAFWRRTLSIMASEKNFSSPFDISQGFFKLEQFINIKNSFNEKELESFLKGVTSFMFVRDPYGRLFSGYINKIYDTNPAFWGRYGTKAVQLFRKNPSEVSLKYGHDVTFAEFVKFILLRKEQNESIDRHFAPMHEKCNPCGHPYDYIGHIETFRQDTEYLFDQWRNKFTDFKIHFDDFEKETVLDTAGLLIRRMFSFYTKNKRNFKYPLYNLVLRAWCDLQIRGYLSKDIPLPYTKHDVENLTAAKMLEAVSAALEIKVNQTAVKLQRRESLQQAYSTESLEDMERLREYVLKDCQLFSYDDRPKLLFDRSNMLETKHFYLAGI